jgi:hypothetical protein
MRTSPAPGGQRVWVAVILGILMLGALGLSLSVVWQRLSQVSDAPAVPLVGDEIGYEALADALLHGLFFHSPVRGPVYSLFIAALYAVLEEHSPAKLLYVHKALDTVPQHWTTNTVQCLKPVRRLGA